MVKSKTLNLSNMDLVLSCLGLFSKVVASTMAFAKAYLGHTLNTIAYTSCPAVAFSSLLPSLDRSMTWEVVVELVLNLNFE